jgi:hypothetical protein
MSRTYLVECYWPGVAETEVADALARAAGEARAHCLESILVPEDEIVFCLFEGPSADEVLAAALRSGLPPERVTESIRIPPQEEVQE